jgi:hypothetical protein
MLARLIRFPIAAVLCLVGLSSQIIFCQEIARPIADERIDRGMRDLRSMSAYERSRVFDQLRQPSLLPHNLLDQTKPNPLKELSGHSSEPGSLHRGDGSIQHSAGVQEMIRRIRLEYEDEWSHPKPSPYRLTVFVDIKQQNGKILAAVRPATDYWFEEMGLQSAQTPVRVKSTKEFDKLIGDATTVVHRGDELPEKWQTQLLEKDNYLRDSDFALKPGLEKYYRATRILERRAEPGKVKILSALPQATNDNELLSELTRMGLQTKEWKRWKEMQSQMLKLEIDLVSPRNPSKLVDSLLLAGQGYQIDTATKQAFLQELVHGNSDYLVLVAHSSDGNIHFTDGTFLTPTELARLSRDEAPDRALILISCDAGTVNGPMPSLGETALRNNLVSGVVAPPRPISAEMVPNLLRSYLLHGQTIKEAFVTGGGFRTVTEMFPVTSENVTALLLPPVLR